MLDDAESSPSVAEPFGCTNTLAPTRKRKNKNVNRFSDEQIKSLESLFESDSRLEPRKKVQLAKELGLQPKQVAIWFQNKRARWKSKQLEHDYSILRANYNRLASSYEVLKKEKQTLAIQLQKLNDLVQKKKEGDNCCSQGEAANSSEGESNNGDKKKCESGGIPCLSFERSEHGLGVISDEDSSIKAEYFGLEEETNLMTMVEPADESLTSQKDWRDLSSDGLFDQSSSGYQWWDFWT